MKIEPSEDALSPREWFKPGVWFFSSHFNPGKAADGMIVHAQLSDGSIYVGMLVYDERMDKILVSLGKRTEKFGPMPLNMFSAFKFPVD